MLVEPQTQNVLIMEEHFHDKTMSPFALYMKDAFYLKPTIEWSMIRARSNMKNRFLCLRKNLAIITYPTQNKVLNKQFEPLCRSYNEYKVFFLLKNYKSNYLRHQKQSFLDLK